MWSVWSPAESGFCWTASTTSCQRVLPRSTKTHGTTTPPFHVIDEVDAPAEKGVPREALFVGRDGQRVRPEMKFGTREEFRCGRRGDRGLRPRDARQSQQKARGHCRVPD